MASHSPPAATAPRSSGILRSLWTLAQPPAFTPRRPHAEAQPFHLERRRGIAPLVDVYLPDTPGPHASVLIVHGGGFVVGSRRMKPVRYLATRLAEAGIAAAAIDYRMIFRGGRLPEALDDVTAAAAWWRDQSDAFALDRERMSIAGFSAGATLALLHASTQQYASIISFFGVYDFTYLSGAWAETMRRLLFRSADPQVWAAHSPLAHCHNPAPLMLVHGGADSLVPIAQARTLQARRAELGLPVHLLEYPDAPHGFLNDATYPATRTSVDAAIAFLRDGPVKAEA